MTALIIVLAYAETYAIRNQFTLVPIAAKHVRNSTVTNLKEDKVMMGFSIAFIIIVLIVLYSLARTAGESDRI